MMGRSRGFGEDGIWVFLPFLAISCNKLFFFLSLFLSLRVFLYPSFWRPPVLMRFQDGGCEVVMSCLMILMSVY